jgi:hypothetical protein
MYQGFNNFGNQTLLSKLNYYSQNDPTIKAFTEDLWNPNQTVYVGWSGEGARQGAIAIATPRGLDHFDRSKWPKTIPTQTRRLSYWKPHPYYDSMRNIDLHFVEGKKPRTIEYVNIFTTNLTWLPDYSGTTKWVFERNKNKDVVIPKVYDRLGSELNVGDFVGFVAVDYTQKGEQCLLFGSVSKIGKTGVTYVKNIKLHDNDRSSERRIQSANKLIKLDDQILKTLMLKRLSL